MSRTRPIAFLVSFCAHVAFLSSLWGPVPLRLPETRRPIEVELQPFHPEARRAPVPQKPQVSRAAPRRRVATPAPAAPALPTVTEAPPTAHVGGGEPGEFEVPGGSGGDDDQGEGPATKPPPPPPDSNAELLVLPRVLYPENARYDGVEGVVRLWVQLDSRGQVVSVEIRDEPGSGLGDAARKALLEATFKPAKHLGHGVATAFEYVYRFELL